LLVGVMWWSTIHAREQKIEGDNAKGATDIRATTPSVQTCRLPLQNVTFYLFIEIR
jgi:hypothetical protein